LNQLLLTSLHSAIADINFPAKRHSEQAKQLINSIFNAFIFDKNDFQDYKEFQNTYFKKIINHNTDRYIVLDYLKCSGILIPELTLNSAGKWVESYTTGKDINGDQKLYKNKNGDLVPVIPVGKRYRISQNLIYSTPISFTNFKGINKMSDRTKSKIIKKNMELVKMDSAVFEFIPQLIENELRKMEIGNAITNKIISIKMGKEMVTEPLGWWLKCATRNGVALIKYNDKFYLEGARTFKVRKRIELEISYTYSVERIINGDFYAARNTTNNRMDYNFTGLKKELWDFVIFDREKTDEVDICNAQFAVMANSPLFQMDEIFVEMAQDGQLYEYLMDKLSMERPEVKEYLIVVMFGEAEYHPEKLNEIFPVTMKSIADFKNEFGYKKFSIELQKGESNIMIDGVFNLLSKNMIPTLPVHDSMRVKVSDATRVELMMQEFFNEKNFKCKLKNK
jgi:hypothetical protein